MNVSLTPVLEDLVRRKVESGAFASVSEVVRDALRTTYQDELELDLLKREAAIGLADVAAGRVKEFSPDTMSEVLDLALTRMQEGHVVKDAIKP